MTNLTGPAGQREQATDATDFYTVLLSMVGHDLRNQLQVLASAHRGLEPHVGEGPQRRFLEYGKHATAQLTRQLDDLLDAMRLYQLQNRVTLESVPIQQVLNVLDLEMSQPAHSKDIMLEVAPTDVRIQSNPNLLLSILRNLTHNALKYTPEGGKVSVICSLRGSALQIDVTDTGIGIAPENLPRIFEPFSRVEADREHGLGLGLFIARRAATMLDHAIEVQSAPGRGSRFSLIASVARDAGTAG